MTYGELSNVVQSLNTGANNPDSLQTICKLVLGNIAKRRMKDRVKLASLATSGSSSLNLRTLLPDFLDFFITVDNNIPRSVYYYESTEPFFFKFASPATFSEHTEGGYVTLMGRDLKFSVSSGQTVPATILFPYYSFYMVLDKDGVTEKESPEDNDDMFLLPGYLDNVLVDGILLYLSRREKENDEFSKNLQTWEKSLSEAIFYN